MVTQYFRITDPETQREEVAQAAAILREGGLLGIPTETVYGLGANGLNTDAVNRIFLAKGRPQDNPLILHIPGPRWLSRYCRNVPPAAYELAERFWPGPLTMILRRRANVPNAVTAGLDTVGVRCPDHPVTLAIIREAGVPVAAPSGNLSGRPSPTCARHMAEDMDGRIDGIVDGGPCQVGVESTILDLTTPIPRLLRPGGLPLEALEEVLGEVAVDKAVTAPLSAGEKPRAPGMKYRHYAPKAPVTVVNGESGLQEVDNAVANFSKLYVYQGKLDNGERVMTVSCLSSGANAMSGVTANVMLPWSAVEGYDLYLVNAGGTETKLEPYGTDWAYLNVYLDGGTALIRMVEQ